MRVLPPKKRKKRTPRLRLHNPEGGGFKRQEMTHTPKWEKKASEIYEKLERGHKLNLNDLRYIVHIKD